MNIRIQHLLVPLDFGPLSTRVLDFAEAIACGPHAEVHLVHVLKQPFRTGGSYDFVLADTPSRRERTYAQACTRLSAMAEALRQKNLTATTEVRTGAVTDEIVSAAIDYGADCIVMGQREHGDLHHVLGGGIGEHVSRRVGCPVLTIRDHGGAKMAAA